MTVLIEEGPNPTTNRNDSAVLGVNKSFQLKRKWPSGQEPGAGGLMGGRPAPPPLYKVRCVGVASYKRSALRGP